MITLDLNPLPIRYSDPFGKLWTQHEEGRGTTTADDIDIPNKCKLIQPTKQNEGHSANDRG